MEGASRKEGKRAIAQPQQPFWCLNLIAFGFSYKLLLRVNFAWHLIGALIVWKIVMLVTNKEEDKKRDRLRPSAVMMTLAVGVACAELWLLVMALFFCHAGAPRPLPPKLSTRRGGGEGDGGVLAALCRWGVLPPALLFVLAMPVHCVVAIL